MNDAGVTRSALTGDEFGLAQCPTCHFSCITNPRTDYEQIYDQSYYRGEGADPCVAYEHEMADRQTIREYEWRGVVRVVGSLRPEPKESRWLDFGCGLGGLVQHLRKHGFDHAFGFDEGYAASILDATNTPNLTEAELKESEGSFDVVTAIEVVEHAVDPVGMLRTVARLLRPGGLLFVTTGNARPFRNRLTRWSYVHPDVHVSYFEPDTLARAMRLAGLTPAYPGYLDGWEDIIRYKVLKELGFKRRNVLEKAMPWSIAARIADRRRGVTAQPVGWKPPTSIPEATV